MKTALIDGDIIAYRAAAACQRLLFGMVVVDEAEVFASIDHEVEKAVERCSAQDYRVAITDDRNWRKDIWPTYKAHRDPGKKPKALAAAKAYLAERHKAYLRPSLEGDDIIGILATHPKMVPGEKIVVSVDKDLRQVPGLHLDKDGSVVEVAERDADYWHLTQTLTGDATDGYPGLPGVGPKKAEAILFGAAPPWGTWAEAWAAIVKAYTERGLTEADALVQARVARICRASDFDFKAKRPIPWNPPKE